MKGLEIIPSFKAISIISTKPIPWIVNGVDQTNAHKNIDFEISASVTLLITTARMVRVVNPNNKDDNFEISAVQIIGSGNKWYYQAGAFQRSFGQKLNTLQETSLVVE